MLAWLGSLEQQGLPCRCLTSDSGGIQWAGTESGVLHRLQLLKPDEQGGEHQIVRLSTLDPGQVGCSLQPGMMAKCMHATPSWQLVLQPGLRPSLLA